MTQIYPVTVTLPAPDWIEGLIVGDQPVVTNQFQSRAESRLRLSSVISQAEMTIYHNRLVSGTSLDAFLAFFKLVGTFEDFTLPTTPNFFATGCPAGREALYRGQSPLGKWRFKDKPVVDDLDLSTYFVVAQLISCVD